MKSEEARELLDRFIQSWLNQNKNDFLSVLSVNIEYSESYGPHYSGINACEQWFVEWNKVARVHKWDVLSYMYDEYTQKMAFEWYFECDYEGNVAGFFGASIMAIHNNQFITIHEYKTETEPRDLVNREGKDR